MTRQKAEHKIIKLADTNAKIREIPKKRRSSKCVQTKLAKEQENLDKTFKLWPDNVEELVNDKDLLFLESMKTDRAASFGSLDTKLQGILQRRAIRELGDKHRDAADKHRSESAHP